MTTTIKLMDNTNKDLVQSFKMTTIRNGFGIYGQRTIIRLIQASQQYLEGKHVRDCETYKIDKSLWGDVQIQFPLNYILAPGDESNHMEARKQLKKLLTTPLEYEKPNGDWVGITLVSRVEFNKSNGEACIKVQPEIWEAIMDFSKGFRYFELNKALELKSAYSVRLYELLSGQEKPLSYKLEDLKKMLGVEKKYDRPYNFINRVIIPAKEELDTVAPYSFDFKPILERKSGRGNAGIVGITFYPLFQPKNRDKKLDEQRKLKRYYKQTFELPQGTKNYLMQVYEFTETMLKNNMLLFCSANDHLDLDDFLRDRDFINRARNAKNPQGYVINALKIELKEKGVKV